MISLSDVTILAIDCQATGANPTKGRLLEIGWLADHAGRGGVDPQQRACAHLLRHPGNPVIPKAVQRITGITVDDLKTASALSESEIWHRLMRTADGIARRNNGREGDDTLCPTVIHYAGFETPFLKALHQAHGAGRPFPFRIICTHAIAIRLLPTLPRRGLRALAGFLDYSLPEKRRSADHVLATAYIWKRLTARLAAEHQIDTLDELEGWLADTRPPNKTPRRIR